jgi:hypothetical protein
MCAPQTRYTTFDQVKKQMFKLHAPHREAGYIARVEYRETIARDGQPDWEMLYTPGPKATAEYQAFTHRHVRQVAPEPRALPPARPSNSVQENNIGPPAMFETSRQRRRREEMQHAEDSHRLQRAHMEVAYEEHQSRAIEQFIAEMPREEYKRVLSEQRQTLKRTYRSMTDIQIDELASASLRAYVRNKYPEASPITFDEYCEKHSSR